MIKESWQVLQYQPFILIIRAGYCPCPFQWGWPCFSKTIWWVDYISWEQLSMENSCGISLSCSVLWLVWGCEVSWGGHHLQRGKNHHRFSSGWSSTWFHSNTGLSSTQYVSLKVLDIPQPCYDKWNSLATDVKGTCNILIETSTKFVSKGPADSVSAMIVVIP